MADIDGISRLLASDIYYHANCMRSYMKKFERNRNCLLCEQDLRRDDCLMDSSTAKELLHKSLEKGDQKTTLQIQEVYEEETNTFLSPCFVHTSCINSYFDVSIDAREEAYITFVKPLISDMLTNGYGLCLSEIRNYISNKMSKQTFYNHHIKNFISKQFESKVSFCAPFRKYESEVVFPSWISQTEMVSKLQALDSVSVAAKLLRSELQKVDFSLSDSFCDKTALENSI